MATSRNLSIIIVVAFSLSSNAQTIEKTFAGWWADTWWTFDFKKDGTYKRTSLGHYGNTEVKGNYKIYNDSVQLISGFRNTDGTVNEFYMLDRDSFLVDLTLLYDYKLTKDKNRLTYNSKKRYDLLKKASLKSKSKKSCPSPENLVQMSFADLNSKIINTDSGKIEKDYTQHGVFCYAG
jgi:hypothetical protein